MSARESDPLSDAHAAAAAPALAPAALARVAALVAREAGLRVPDWVLAARVGERVAALGLDLRAEDEGGPDPAHTYAALVTSSAGAAERALLFEALRVGETRFFRHEHHVRTLIDVVVPALARKYAASPRTRRLVRVWSAGCADGQEAYTLALVLGARLPDCDVRVLGTDLSARALDTARAAVYPAEALASVPEPWCRQGFELDGERCRVAPAVRSRVSFVRHNLLDGAGPEGWDGVAFDVIWCRNVFIYFAPEARRQVAASLAGRLAADGVLFVGYAESLRDVPGLAALRTPEAVLYRRAAAPASPRARRTTPASGRLQTSDRATAAPRATPASGRLQTSDRATAAPRATPASGRLRTSDRATAAPRARRTTPASGRVQARPGGTRAGADAGARRRPRVELVHLSGRYEDGERLGRELRAMMTGACDEVVIDLDDARFLGDAAAAVLRRAANAARAAGVTVTLRASRAGARRWLRRHGLRGADESMDDLPAIPPGRRRP